jgi:penicillin-binding protein 2
MNKTGIALGDFISTENIKRRSWSFDPHDKKFRNYFLIFLFGFLFFILFSRLFFLQVISGSYYKYLSDTNRIKAVVIHAPRGIIFDRNGVPLTFNLPGFRELVNGKTTLLSKDEALVKIANGQRNLEVDSLRNYPYKEAFAHVLGYIGQISPEELKSPEFAGYRPGDLIGKMGIEQEYESLLKGIDGRQLYEVDATGKLIRKLGQDDPVAGENIVTTLDEKLQLAVVSAAKDVKKGAIIVSNPKGEILALFSKPTFDPNLFTMGADYQATSSSYLTLDELMSDYKNQPFLDRAISGVYPPGSTFKLIVAAAGLSNNIIDENWQIDDTGILKVGDFSFSNWYYTGYGGTDGQVNVIKGIKRSNDIFFYKLAEKVGVDKVSKTAIKFGLDKKLGIDLLGESAGTVPTPEWKLKNIGEQWYLGDTYHYGIGQGFLLTTPLQVNWWTEAIANNGTQYVPHIFKNQSEKLSAKNLLDNHATELIREGMIEACSTGGVAWPLFDFKVKNQKLKIDGKNILEVPLSSGSADMRKVVVACKTGTAETTPNQDPHAWITLFAPAYDPQIVVTVLSENSGEGSNVAGPIAKKILDEWFGR